MELDPYHGIGWMNCVDDQMTRFGQIAKGQAWQIGNVTLLPPVW